MSYSKNILLLFIIFTILFYFSLELQNLRIKEEDEEKKELEKKEKEEEEDDDDDDDDEKEEKSNVNPPKFSRVSGFYPDDFKLKLLSEENYEIYYTDDSTDPRTSNSSQKYKDYILIYDKTSDPNIYSAIGQNDSSPVSISVRGRYIPPFYPVDKAMIIRAVTKNSKGEFSDIITKTYFVTNGPVSKYQDLTVLSIVTNPENLFDPEFGIYVSGNMYQEAWRKAVENNETDKFNPRWAGSNFQQKGKDWERESFLTIFDKGDINVQQKVGLRIKGAVSRLSASKSFNIFARKKYGKSKIETNILKNKNINGSLITSYKALSLRNIYSSSRLRDKIAKDLCYEREGLTFTNMTYTVLFLNGEYWGFFLLQEKFDSVFISEKYLIPKKKVVIGKCRGFEDGDEEEYNNFVYFCGNYSKKDVSDEKIYNEIKNYIDIDSFVELFANGLYTANTDWPGNNDGEWKYLGKPIEGNKYSDGKWRFYIFDLDLSMNSPNSNTFLNVEVAKRINYSYVQLYYSLVHNNSDFRHKIVNRICDYANNIGIDEILKKLIEEYREETTDIIADSQLRWSSRNTRSKLESIANYKTSYLRSLDSLYNFYDKRPTYFLQHMKQYLKLKGNPVNLTIEIQGKGKIQINSILPKFKNGEWTGKYFSLIPIDITAIPDKGYIFKEWDGEIKSIQQKEEITLFNSSKIFAIFEKNKSSK